MKAETDIRFESIRRLLSSVRLLPKEQVRYQPILVDALLFFLSRLPDERIDHILLTQAALGHGVTPDDRLVALLLECPTLHKLGQVVARERFLPQALRERLPALESLPPTTDVTGMTRELQDELRYVPGLEIAKRALAEGSVAVVIPFEWVDGSGVKQRGVFKVLKPRAVEWMRQELAVWPEFSEYLAAHAGADGLPMLDYREMLDGVGRLLLNEIDLEKEQHNLTWAHAFYAGSPEVKIPQLLPFSTPRVTAMERIDGVKVTDPTLNQRLRDRLAKSMVKAMIATPFWRIAHGGTRFHADPHAGNLLVTPDGRLAILDWALVTELGEAQLSGVVRALLAALTFDETILIPAIGELGRVDDEALLRHEVAEGLRRVRRGAAPGFVWLTDLLDRLGRAGAMHFPEEITLFRKSMLTLSDVVADVSEHVHPDQLLVRSGVRQFLRELRARLDAPLGSRSLGTHLSTSDLVRVWTAVPFISTRFFLDSWRDLLREREKASRVAKQ